MKNVAPSKSSFFFQMQKTLPWQRMYEILNDTPLFSPTVLSYLLSHIITFYFCETFSGSVYGKHIVKKNQTKQKTYPPID